MSFTMKDASVRVKARLVARLARDLERIRRGEGPTSDELANAPLVEDWMVVPVVGTGLLGRVAERPGQVDDSELFLLDKAGGHCRTLGGLYRLGKEQGRK